MYEIEISSFFSEAFTGVGRGTFFTTGDELPQMLLCGVQALGAFGPETWSSISPPSPERIAADTEVRRVAIG